MLKMMMMTAVTIGGEDSRINICYLPMHKNVSLIFCLDLYDLISIYLLVDKNQNIKHLGKGREIINYNLLKLLMMRFLRN